MSTIYWTCFLLLFTVGYCYENLCLSKRPNTRASQSSVHENQIASKVIDGNKRQDYGSCAETRADQLAPAWVKVDLGGIYSLSHVVIYYRIEFFWKPYRFRQYYLEVSKTSYSRRIRCYTDTTPDSEIPNDIQNITCKEEARYVIVETNYDAPEDSARGPILEICEIEVYGCDIGHFGQSCQLCPGCSKCDIDTGACDIQCSINCIGGQCEASGLCTQGCVDGYTGSDCTQLCSDRCNPRNCSQYTGTCADACVVGYYGLKCETPCSTACSLQSCRKDDGTCVDGCKIGFYGSQCQKRCGQRCQNKTCDFSSGHCNEGCDEWFYGNFCNQTCSSNCANGRCNQSNGYCNECLPNWTGNTCDRCVSTHYGFDCSQPCSRRCKEGTCNNYGYCYKGCFPGYFGDYCDNLCSSSCRSVCNRTTGECSEECVNGYYGPYCKLSCNTYCKDMCDKNTGICVYGCQDGKFGEMCKNDCNPGCDTRCEQITGNCTCKQGWQGHKCNECKPDFYGNCTKRCSSNCLVGHCHVENGTCLGGCKRGFLGDQCDKVSSSIGDLQTGYGISKTSSVIIAILSTLLAVTLMCVGMRIVINKRKRRNTLRRKDQADRMPANSVQNPQSYDQIVDTIDDHTYHEINSLPNDADYQELHVYKNTEFPDSK